MKDFRLRRNFASLSFLRGYYEGRNDYETDIAITGNFVRVGHALKDTQ